MLLLKYLLIQGNKKFNVIIYKLFKNIRYENGSVVISNITPCNNNSFDCTQLVSLNFVKGSASASCDALSGSITVQFIVNCSQGYGSNCPVNGSQTATITVTLQTGNACPTTQTIQFSTATLTGNLFFYFFFY